MNKLLELLLNSQQAQAPAHRTDDDRLSPLDDGGFTRNVLMKGIPGMENPTPSFTGINNTAWTPNGPMKQPIAVKPDDMPMSPLKPETQSLMPAAKPVIVPEQAIDAQIFKQKSQPQEKAAAAPAETPAQKEEMPAAPEAPKEPSMLDKLLEAYNTPQRDTELEEAQARRNDLQRQLAMLKGFNQIGSSIAQVKPQDKYLEEETNLAGMPVKDIEQRREQERKMKAEKGEALKFGMDVEKFKQDSEAKGIDLEKARLQLKDAKANKDPNSDISKATREAIMQRFKLAGANVNVPQGLSSDQLRTMFPMGDIVDDLIKERGRKEAAEERKAMAKERQDNQKQQQQSQLTTHISDKIKSMDEKIGYNKALTDYEMLKNRMAQGKFDSVSDLTATYSLMKALDPNSVVRESEFENLVKTQGGLNAIRQAPQRFFKGDIYSPQFREKLMDQLAGVVDARRSQLHKVLEPDLKRAKDLGIDESYILAPSTSKSFQQMNAPQMSVADSAAAELARRKKGK